jgi:hypothetical protein
MRGRPAHTHRSLANSDALQGAAAWRRERHIGGGDDCVGRRILAPMTVGTTFTARCSTRFKPARRGGPRGWGSSATLVLDRQLGAASRPRTLHVARLRRVPSALARTQPALPALQERSDMAVVQLAAELQASVDPHANALAEQLLGANSRAELACLLRSMRDLVKTIPLAENWLRSPRHPGPDVSARRERPKWAWRTQCPFRSDLTSCSRE